MTVSAVNPLGIVGFAGVEFTAPSRAERDAIGQLLRRLGFARRSRHSSLAVDGYQQHDIHFWVNHESEGFSAQFALQHGPSIPAMAWWVTDPEQALTAARARGARVYSGAGIFGSTPAVYGIGDSLIYLLPRARDGASVHSAYLPLDRPETVSDRGFLAVDHLTNNVERGSLERWSEFYRHIFGFTEIRSFDIRGQKTGLTSYALRSPCGTFSIPINEGAEDKSQIEEYLRDYRGAGIQHIALSTRNLLESLRGLDVETLDIDAAYYRDAFQRVKTVREDREQLEQAQVLVDGDEQGYLLQIFTRNVVGPIFFELIQRENHHSFGEGNFGALFRSIERDQERRGCL